MTDRSHDEYNHERGILDQAHTQNENARDSFVALGHTALFAASVSFVGSAVPINGAVWRWALISGWSIDVIGLLALTFSFGAARRAIDARRLALNQDTPPSNVFADMLNSVSLWSFPAALVCLFAFVTANVVHTDDRKDPVTPAKSASNNARVSAAAACTGLSRNKQPTNRGSAAAESSDSPRAVESYAASQAVKVK